MKSKTKISRQAEKKLSPEIVSTILDAKKKKKWLEVAGVLTGSRRNKVALNLDEIGRRVDEEKVKETVIVVPGKVLGQGDLKKKLKIVALSFSEQAAEKLKKNKIDFLTIKEEIKAKPDAKNMKMLK
jgi:large subunit ribosomal protein L18e